MANTALGDRPLWDQPCRAVRGRSTPPHPIHVQPPPAVSMTPTAYLDQPGSSPIVNNDITVNVASPDFSAWSSTIATRDTHEFKVKSMAADTTQQLAAEIKPDLSG